MTRQEQSEQHQSEHDDVVRILGLEDSDDRALFRRPQEWRIGRSQLPADVFRQRVAAFLETLRPIIASLPQGYGDFELNDITVSAEVSAKGQLSLLGAGGELTGTSSMTFTFTRKAAFPPASSPDEDTTRSGQ
ncbi:Pepco domain-containing protein [Streptomyces sp. 3N207]|uniref:Pepco domain-containing protein n=1 Tax=Streptomyces sp. 3N207 TaxID=3457417 RepID=UPI003FD2E4CB